MYYTQTYRKGGIEMKAVSTLRIANELVFYGPGPQMLLKKIDETASLRKATMEIGISYTKALKMLKKIEQELGFAIVISEKGGNAHGGTVLTEKGKTLVAIYDEIQVNLQEYAQSMVTEKLAFLQGVTDDMK